MGDRSVDVNDLLERREAVLGGKNLRLFYDPHPLCIVKGEGVYLEGHDGKRYLDCYNNVASLGHCHPEVVSAQQKQCGLLCSNTRYLSAAPIEYAEALLNTLRKPTELDTVVFVNSGSEANDLAWRIATAITGKRGGLCSDGAYHGITKAVSDFTPSSYRSASAPAHMKHIAPPDDYRKLYDPERYLEVVERQIDELELEQHGLAGVMIDPLYMSNGVLVPKPGYLQSIAELVQKKGGMYIADEVQSGYGRTGEAFWGFEYHNIAPDFVTIGKPAGNGHPVGALLTKRRYLDEFQKIYGFFSTFGGNNVSAVVGKTVIDVIQDNDLLSNCRKMGKLFKNGLNLLKEQHSVIGDVRGIGLAMGIELVEQDGRPAKALCEEFLILLSQEGCLCGADGQFGNVVKIRPPLTFTETDVQNALKKLFQSWRKEKI